jgi:hypothetical protein
VLNVLIELIPYKHSLAILLVYSYLIWNDRVYRHVGENQVFAALCGFKIIIQLNKDF